MTDNHSAVTAAELDELDRRLRMLQGRLGNDAADTIASLRKQLDAAQRLATEYEKGLSIAEQMCRDLGRDTAKKDAALREIAHECREAEHEENFGGPVAHLAEAMRLLAERAITPASQEAPAAGEAGFTLHGEDLLPYKGASKTQRYVVLRRAAPASPSPEKPNE